MLLMSGILFRNNHWGKKKLFYVQTCTETKRSVNVHLVWIIFVYINLPERHLGECVFSFSVPSIFVSFPWSFWYFHISVLHAFYLYPKEACLLRVEVSPVSIKEREVIFWNDMKQTLNLWILKIWEMYCSKLFLANIDHNSWHNFSLLLHHNK